MRSSIFFSSRGAKPSLVALCCCGFSAGWRVWRAFSALPCSLPHHPMTASCIWIATWCRQTNNHNTHSSVGTCLDRDGLIGVRLPHFDYTEHLRAQLQGCSSLKLGVIYTIVCLFQEALCSCRVFSFAAVRRARDFYTVFTRLSPIRSTVKGQLWKLMAVDASFQYLFHQYAVQIVTTLFSTSVQFLFLWSCAEIVHLSGTFGITCMLLVTMDRSFVVAVFPHFV